MSEVHIFVIPARGGSKRLPRKNLRLLWGKPLVMHSVDAALSTSVGTRRVVCVSTEDPEVRTVVGSVAGVTVVDRPPHLAADDVPTQPVLKHAVSTIESQLDIQADIVWWMNASIPQVTPEDLEDGYSLLRSRDLLEVFTIDRHGIGSSGVRLMRRFVLFADRLSTNFGAVQKNYIDIHYASDLERLEQLS
jgi:CMP-N-acetylneuraminic acid synthetase